MPDLSLITTCRGRLAHLKESLPTFLAQTGAECIVVDYDCPERAGDWSEQHFPQVKVVRAGKQPVFEVCRARNLGAAAATSPRLVFVDADVCLSEGFAAAVRERLERKMFLRAFPLTNETYGTIACWREDFERIGGFDDVLQGWGNDDIDLIARLERIGSRLGVYPGELLRSIPHSHAMRVQHYDVQDLRVNGSLNRVYMQIKLDLMHFEQRELSRERRQQLYASIRSSILSALQNGRPLRLTLPVPKAEADILGPVERSLVYVLPEIGKTKYARKGSETADGHH